MAHARVRKTTVGPSATQTFTAVFRKTKNWWVAYVEELPGANTQGKTKAQARRNLREAVRMIIRANRELAARELRGARVVREELTIKV